MSVELRHSVYDYDYTGEIHPIVMIVEGVHGVGKTTFVKSIEEEYPNGAFLTDNFVDFIANDAPFKGQIGAVSNEICWTAQWIEKLVELIEVVDQDIKSMTYKGKYPLFRKRPIIVTDRSPISTFAYAQSAAVYTGFIDGIIVDLRRNGIIVSVNVLVDGEEAVLKRILERGPNKEYNEHSREHLKRVTGLYNSYIDTHQDVFPVQVPTLKFSEWWDEEKEPRRGIFSSILYNRNMKGKSAKRQKRLKQFLREAKVIEK